MSTLPMDVVHMTPLGEVRYIVVHTEGSPSGSHGSAVSVNRYHREERGWLGIGYHAYVEEDGTLVEGRPVTKMGAGVEGFNAHSLHICASGNGDRAPFNPAQMRAIATRVAQWARTFNVPLARVLGHHECYRFPGVPDTGKTCPGTQNPMDAVREAVAAELLASLASPAPKIVAPKVEAPAPPPMRTTPVTPPPAATPLREDPMDKTAALEFLRNELTEERTDKVIQFLGDQAKHVLPDLPVEVAKRVLDWMLPDLLFKALNQAID